MSDNIFLWQENTNDNCIFLLQMREEKQPILLTITLAGDIIDMQDSFISNQGGSLKIPLVDRMRRSASDYKFKSQSAVFDKTVQVFDSMDNENLEFKREFFIGDYAHNPSWKRRHDSIMDNIESGFFEAVEELEDFFEEDAKTDFNSLNMKFSD